MTEVVVADLILSGAWRSEDVATSVVKRSVDILEHVALGDNVGA